MTEDLIAKCQAVTKTIGDNALRKARLDERLSSATAALKKVVDEVRASGHDPKTLDATLAEKESLLATEISRIEKEVQAQSEALSAIERSL